MPDTLSKYDLSLELMKLSVKAGSSQFYKKATNRLCMKLSWTPKKMTRVLNNKSQVLEIEQVVINMELSSIKKELAQLS